MVVDTISPFLDLATIRPGASSYPYDLDIGPGNVIRFSFSDIMLPDSNVNEAASHGFVKFKIDQQRDNPIGTIITNCLLYTSPSPRDGLLSRMPSSA